MSMSVWSKDRGKPWVLVSYYTDDFYLREAWELVRSCQDFGPDFLVEEVKLGSSWLENTNHKPFFIQRMINIFPQRHLIWLDADARFRQHAWLIDGPRLPSGDSIAYRTIHGKPASGTILLPNTPDRINIVETWCEEVRRDTNATDQVCLGRAVDRLKIPRMELPMEYCWIYDFDASGKKIANPSPLDTKPVIEHMQASRWRRK